MFVRKPVDKKAADIHVNAMAAAESVRGLCAKATKEHDKVITDNEIHSGLTKQLQDSCLTDLNQARAHRDEKRPAKDRRYKQATANLTQTMLHYDVAEMPKKPDYGGFFKQTGYAVIGEGGVWAGSLFTAGAGGLIPVGVAASVIALANPALGTLTAQACKLASPINTKSLFMRRLYTTAAVILPIAALSANYILAVLRDKPDALKTDLPNAIANGDITLGGGVMFATGLAVFGATALKWAYCQEWNINLHRAGVEYYTAKDAVEADNPAFCNRAAKIARAYTDRIVAHEKKVKENYRLSKNARQAKRPIVQHTEDRLKRLKKETEYDLAQSKLRAKTLTIGDPSYPDTDFDVDLSKLLEDTPTVADIQAEQEAENEALKAVRTECRTALNAILTHERVITADLSSAAETPHQPAEEQYTFDDAMKPA